MVPAEPVGLAVLAEAEAVGPVEAVELAVLAEGAEWGVGVSSLVVRQVVNWLRSLLETSWIRPRPN